MSAALAVPVSVALSRLMAAIRSRPMRELWTRQALSSLSSLSPPVVAEEAGAVPAMAEVAA